MKLIYPNLGFGLIFLYSDVSEDNQNKEIQFLQYDNILQVITAISGHVTTLDKSEFENSILLVYW